MTGKISFLTLSELENNTIINDCEAIIIDNKIVLFTNHGVF